MSFRIFAAVAGAMLAVGSPASAETLTNAAVIELVKAGLGDQAVIAKIKSTPGSFQLASPDLIALKDAGVSGEVIAAMITGYSAPSQPAAMSTTAIDPNVPHPSGLYMIDAANDRVNRIDATVTSQAKTGGIFGYALTGGIASMSVKVAIAGEGARVVAANGKPDFFFFFDASNPATANLASSWASGSAQTVSSPGEFTLVRLDQKQGRREARVGSMNIAGAKSGVMDKDRIAFDYQLVREGVYKVSPKQTLAAGQYAFLYALAGGGTNGAMSARLFDFAIPATLAKK